MATHTYTLHSASSPSTVSKTGSIFSSWQEAVFNGGTLTNINNSIKNHLAEKGYANVVINNVRFIAHIKHNTNTAASYGCYFSNSSNSKIKLIRDPDATANQNLVVSSYNTFENSVINYCDTSTGQISYSNADRINIESGITTVVTVTWSAWFEVIWDYDPTYTITTNTNNSNYGTVSGGGAYAEGTSITLTASPAAGYYFTGWSGASTSTTNPLTITVSSNQTYTANFAPNIIGIKYNGNGASGSLADTSASYGSSFVLPSNPFTVPTGYSFGGWKINNTGDTYAAGTSITINQTSGTITLYAQWIANTYTFNFYQNDNTTLYTTKQVIYTNSLSFPANPGPSTGHTALGWSTTKGATTKQYDFNVSKSLSELGLNNTTTTINYYLVQTPNTYTITYNSNGGTGTMSDQSPTYGNSITLTSNSFIKTGYTFNGWLGNNGETYTNGATFNYNIAGNLTLTAQWTPISYTITYDLVGGNVSTANPDTYTIETTTFTLNNPIKTGYDFIGWTGSNGLTPQISISITKGTTGNKSYTANWQLKTYNITYNSNTTDVVSNLPAAQVKEYGVDLLLSSNIPTRNNYTFTNWNSKSDGTGVVYSAGATYTLNENIILYAQWKANTISMNVLADTSKGIRGSISSTLSDLNNIPIGEKFTITANPNTGEYYYFKKWIGPNGEIATPTITITPEITNNGDTYTAYFGVNKIFPNSTPVKQIYANTDNLIKEVYLDENLLLYD